MSTTTTTVIGNLTADPELRQLPSGDPTATFTIASTPRHYDTAARAWADDPTLFLRCSLLGAGAENAAAGLARGTRVIACGALTQHSYTDQHGQNRTVTELHIQEIGPSVRYAQVHVTRAGRIEETASTSHDEEPGGGTRM